MANSFGKRHSRRRSRRKAPRRKRYKKRKSNRRGRRRSRRSSCKGWFGFGSAYSPNLSSVMGNFRPPYQMSYDQIYTGMGPYQTNNHYAAIQKNLKSNFYNNNPPPTAYGFGRYVY